jgi:hypothetical protein
MRQNESWYLADHRPSENLIATDKNDSFVVETWKALKAVVGRRTYGRDALVAESENRGKLALRNSAKLKSAIPSTSVNKKSYGSATQ